MSGNAQGAAAHAPNRTQTQAFTVVDAEADYVAARQRLDRENGAVLDALPSSAAVVDQDGVILKVNSTWRRFARENGYRGDRFFVGTNYFETCGGESRDVVDGITAVLRGDAAEFQKKYTCHSPLESRWFRLVSTPVELAGRHGALIIHIDITREHRDQEMLSRALSGAHRRHGLREQYFAGVNHDLKNPLNAIVGYASLLTTNDPVPAEKRLRFAENIDHAAGYMLRIVDSILTMAEKETEFYEIAESWIDVRSATQLAVDRMRAVSAGHPIDLVRADEDALPRLRADEIMLNRMIENLLSNAIKYGAGSTIRLRAYRDRDELVIAVEDNGPGMAPEQIEKVILPFKRADAVDAEGMGMGLGLALVNSMIEAHAGSLDIESSPGAGTTVSLRFPADRLED